MASSRIPPSDPSFVAPVTKRDLEQLYEGYRGMLAGMTPAQLMEHATQLGALIEQDQRARMESLMRSGSSSSIDSPVLRSMPTATPSPTPYDARQPDRGAAASAPPSLPSNPLELLASSTRTGPRLAAKLVLADARRRARRLAAE